MVKYTYDGPVVMFGNCICNSWHGETYAETVNKAKSNLTYQFKKKNNLTPSSKVTLSGNVVQK